MKGCINVYVDEDYEVHSAKELREDLMEGIKDGDFDESLADWLDDNFSAYELFKMDESQHQAVLDDFLEHLLEDCCYPATVTIDTEDVQII